MLTPNPNVDSFSVHPPSRPAATGPAFQVAAQSVTGSQHEKEGASCQDAYYFRLLRPNLLVAAVADGAGSARHGALGARAAVKASVDYLTVARRFVPDQFGWKRQITSEALRRARQQIQRAAEHRSKYPSELATTLLVTIATPNSVTLGQIGDGGAVVRDCSGDLHLLAQPQKGEYPNQTVFVSSPDALHQPRIALWPRPFGALSLFTDGLEQLALEGLPRLMSGDGGLTPYPGFLVPLFEWFNRRRSIEHASIQLRQFLRSPTVQDHTDDDLTLLLASL